MVVNYSEANDLLPEGEYECIIRQVALDVTRGGTEYIDIPLIIRNDVERNPRRGGIIFHKLWRRKEPTAADKACNGFSAKQIQSLSKAAGLPNGKSYPDMEEWMADLAGRLVRATVYHEEYKGVEQAKVSWVNQTREPICKHVYNGAAPAPDGPELQEMDNEEDVPF